MDQDLDAVFRALADPGRRRLLDLLRERNGRTLGELCGHLPVTRQAVAQHLGILEEADLVVAVRRGREKLHYLNPVPIHAVARRWIGRFERHRLRALEDLKSGLEGTTHGRAGLRVRDLRRRDPGAGVGRADGSGVHAEVLRLPR